MRTKLSTRQEGRIDWVSFVAFDELCQLLSFWMDIALPADCPEANETEIFLKITQLNVEGKPRVSFSKQVVLVTYGGRPSTTVKTHGSKDKKKGRKIARARTKPTR